MNRYIYLIFIITILLIACGEKQPANTYYNKVDSASIGLTKKLDTLTRVQYTRPELPEGLIIDTGSNNPFAADTAYLPVNTTPANSRYRPDYSTLETTP